MATGFSSRSELESLEGKKTSAASGWFKRISRWFKARKRSLADRKLKRHLERLEKERLAEKTALSERRRLYERLFRRRIKSLDPETPHPAKEQAVKPVPARVAPLPPAAPVPEPSKLMPEAPKQEALEPEAEVKAAEAPLILTEPEWMQDAPVPLASPDVTAEAFAAKEEFRPTPAPAPLPPASQPLLETKPRASAGFLSRLFRKAPRSLSEKLAREREEELAWQEKNEVEKRFWQPYKGVKPNLIKNQGTVFFNWHEHMLILALSLVMCCLAISLVYVGLLIWQKERLDNNRATVLNTRVIEAEIKKSERDVAEVKAFNDKLKAVSALLDNHVYWTNFLTFLEDNTLKEVYYEKFNGDLTGRYVIPSVGRNLESVSLQLDVMKAGDKVKDVSYDAGQGRAASSTVRFNLGLTVDPKLFLK